MVRSTADMGRFADALLIVGEGPPSDFCGFRQGQCVIDVDPEIPNGVLDLTVSEQQLDRPQVPCRFVDEGSFRAAKRVGAVLFWPQPDGDYSPV